MTRLISVDPGERTGIAVFDGGELREARVERYCEPSGAEAVVVVELPRWYPRRHHVDVNDLIDLAVKVGEIRQRHGGAELVTARAWKGTVDPDISNRRVLRALRPAEVALLPRRPRAGDHDHNMLDAVGLGLWKLGRF